MYGNLHKGILIYALNGVLANLRPEKCNQTQQTLAYTRLLKEYIADNLVDPTIPPLINGKVVVQTKPWFEMIQHVQEAESSIGIRMGLTMTIQTTMLWKPDQYCDLYYLMLSTFTYGQALWTPPLEIANTYKREVLYPSLLKLTANGSLDTYQTLSTHLECQFNMRYYPFDVQQCQIHFWLIENFDIIDLVGAEMNTQYFQANIVWDFLGVATQIDNQTSFEYHRVQVNDTQIRYFILLRRKPNFYVFSVLVPVICLANLSVIIFIMPSDASVKMNICVSMLLSFYVFFTSLNNILPPSSGELPIVYVYILTTFVSLCAATIMASLIQHIAARRTTKDRVTARRLNSVCLVVYVLCQLTVDSWMYTEYTMKAEPRHVNNTYIWDDSKGGGPRIFKQNSES